jgi:4-alpha-glucanotransferase
MSDAAVRDVARRAGIAVKWIDSANKPQRVSIEVMRHILAALGLPCGSPEDLTRSRHELSVRRRQLPPLITATVGEAVILPIADGSLPARVRLVHEDGTTVDLAPQQSANGRASLQPVSLPGYYTLDLGERSVTLAAAPPRCRTVEDITPGSLLWALAVQVYGLRRPGDSGIGDMGAVGMLAESAARLEADALALSPTHAMFTADPGHFSPYSPSSRLFHNPLHADPRSLFGAARVAQAIHDKTLEGEPSDLETRSQIDWPQAARVKLSIFRRLFDHFASTDLIAVPATRLAADFAQFRADGGDLLEEHARFEALHAERLSINCNAWDWRSWPVEWRGPHGPALEEFAASNQREILFHSFLQWIAERSFAAAQKTALQSGMRIGLIADLAVGMSGGGSHAWARQNDILVGLNVGAPPDQFNSLGQNWGLTTFSPHALVAGGFAPFIATLRAGMQHCGGLRIDHAMGLMRLWVIPDGGTPQEGAYLAYPLDDLLRLTALESHRQCAIVIGEDLGTVPPGFRERLVKAGIAGMRVLWFERQRRRFVPPDLWPTEAAAMTSTHDLPTVAGWWRGTDIAVRARCGLGRDSQEERAARDMDRQVLWSAFRAANVEQGPPPPPDGAPRVVDAAVRFIGRTPTRLALVPLEDALALEHQPNVPGTIDEHPNWRRRYQADASKLLDDANVRSRLEGLSPRGER